VPEAYHLRYTSNASDLAKYRPVFRENLVGREMCGIACFVSAFDWFVPRKSADS
jgi:hypothetical protein